MKRHRHQEEEIESSERWLVSYSDFITLLFAFFVVMYSVSAINLGKFRVVSESIQAALRPVVSPPASAPHFHVDDYKSSLVPTTGRQTQFIRQIQAVLDHFTDDLMLHGFIVVARTEEGVRLTIQEQLVFESGRAELRPRAFPLFEALAEVLGDPEVKEIDVQGHTDDQPLRAGPYPSNWELSMARAVAVVRSLSEQYRVPAERFSANGYGAFRPVSTEPSEEGRVKNRRVELLVVLDEPPDWEP